MDLRRIARMMLVAAGICGPLAYAHLAGMTAEPVLLADLVGSAPAR